MQVPLVLTFHNVARSQWAQDEIRARVAELERIYGRLNSCRVRVDQRAESRTGSIPPVVRIEGLVTAVRNPLPIMCRPRLSGGRCQAR